MNYQKIILAGKISNEPTTKKTEEGMFTELRFEMTFRHFSNEITFPVVVVFAADDVEDRELIMGSSVLVEGVMDLDKEGRYFVKADWLEKE
jgi:hypothetical protein